MASAEVGLLCPLDLPTRLYTATYCLIAHSPHSVAGPYAKAVVLDVLGLPASSLVNCDPKPVRDFSFGSPPLG